MMPKTNKTNLKYIIFDIDGTLTNTIKVDDACYIASFESLFETSIKGVQWSQFNNVTDWGITEELIKLKFNRTTNPEDIQSLKTLFISKIKDAFKADRSNFQEIHGAKRFYDLVAKNDQFKLGIATGGWAETASFKLNGIGIDPNKVCYSNSNYFKEREKIVLDVIDKLNTEKGNRPEEIIYFGDGEWDYITCQKLGIRFIGMDSQLNNKLKTLGASEIYQDFRHADDIMHSLLKSST